MSAVFKDQFLKMSEWFSSWNECEQVVALYNLIKKMTPSQACFLSKVLPQLPSSNTSLDIELLDYQANDPNFITNLRKEPPEAVIKELVKLLPLLKPCSFLAAKEYVKLISFIIMNLSFKTFVIDDLYQIIFYLSLHPSISKEDWQQLYLWQSSLEELSTMNKADNVNESFSLSESLLPLVQVSDASPSRSGAEAGEIGKEGDIFNSSRHFMAPNYFFLPFPQEPYISRKSSGSMSHLDEASKHHQALTRTPSISSYAFCSDWITHNAIKGNCQKNQVYLKADHAPLSPQSSGASTGSAGSESHVLSEEVDSAMIDVSMWLKSLRLHKYLFLFEKLNYAEMMNLTEEWLAGQGVTKGARNKILVNIKRLQERSEQLKTIEKSILGGQDLAQCVADLKPIVFAPISPSDKYDSSAENASEGETLSTNNRATPPGPNCCDLQMDVDRLLEENLPAQISRVLGKLCSQLLVASCPDSECLLNYLQLLERCSNHFSFSADQKKKMHFWKQQIQSTWSGLLNKHSNRCKANYSQNLAPPFIKVKSKLALRYSNPVHPSQTSLSSKPPLMMHHLHQATHPNPSQQLFSHPSPSLLPRPAGTMFHPHQPFHKIHPLLQHSEAPPLFGRGTLNAPLHLKIEPQHYRNQFIHDSPSETISLKMPLGRTQSAPLSSPAPHKSFIPSDTLENDPASSPTTEDIHANLESLCINMMEHALGNSND